MLKTKIAIIEDELAIQQMYKFRLELANFEVSTANDGRAGLLLIETFVPKLILVDLKMPLMNGDEMIEKLRSTVFGVNIKIIVLTNISKDEAPRHLQFLRIDRYIVKAHHTPLQITNIVHDVLAKSKTKYA